MVKHTQEAGNNFTVSHSDRLTKTRSNIRGTKIVQAHTCNS
jgi:hypothetical protein